MTKKKIKNISDTDFNDLAGVLNFELTCRQDNNEKYSLRAFSKQIGIVTSQLSLILKKKKGLSSKKALVVGRALGYKKAKLDWFVCLVEKDFSRSPVTRTFAKNKIKDYRNGVIRDTLVKHDLVLNWYHFAIRRMTLLPDFQLEPRWIANRLALTLAESKQAIDDLLKHELIIKNKDKYEAVNNMAAYFSYDDGPQKLVDLNLNLSKKIHSKILEDNSNAVYFGSHYFTIDSANIPTLKKITQKYEDQVDDLTYKKGAHDTLIAMKLEIVRIDEKV